MEKGFFFAYSLMCLERGNNLLDDDVSDLDTKKPKNTLRFSISF